MAYVRSHQLEAAVNPHPDEWITRLATLPLIDEPGVGFHYGLSTGSLGLCWRGSKERRSVA
jgi:hypothetical protein